MTREETGHPTGTRLDGVGVTDAVAEEAGDVGDGALDRADLLRPSRPEP